MNLGFVSLFLRWAFKWRILRQVFKALSGKMGVVLLALGFKPCLNLALFAKIRRHPTQPCRVRRHCRAGGAGDANRSLEFCTMASAGTPRGGRRVAPEDRNRTASISLRRIRVIGWRGGWV